MVALLDLGVNFEVKTADLLIEIDGVLKRRKNDTILQLGTPLLCSTMSCATVLRSLHKVTWLLLTSRDVIYSVLDIFKSIHQLIINRSFFYHHPISLIIYEYDKSLAFSKSNAVFFQSPLPYLLPALPPLLVDDGFHPQSPHTADT